ncbi:hypothetical protein ACTWP6_17240 [Mycobacterium sp. 4D054]|uniref:hypothetical protein n=1 Tax=Mycobacterium sp. 4D054 TaxID=3457440 RepID=UPI003FD67E9B
MSPHEPESDDEDTGPLHVDSLRNRPAEVRDGHHGSPVAVNPRPVQRDRRPVVLVAGAAVAVVGLGLLAWTFWPSSGAGDSAGETTTTTQAETQERAEARLREMLPVGYAPDACESVVPAKGALAQLSCTKNDDTGGPLSALYTLARDDEAVKDLFDGVVSTSAVVNCPGNIQSPVLCPTGVSKTVCGIGSVRMGATAAR